MLRNIRNIAIIAHVDHGKTTLVDALLKQSHIFREDQVVGNLLMDSNELEREKGITILAKNTAVTYGDVKINIIDTPGHADFSGEVERVLNMADGCLLIIDAVDGPMPQTRFVLRHALQKQLRPVVVINKIDRPSARPLEVAEMTQDLFLELATDAEQLSFPILYASAKEGYAVAEPGDAPVSMGPLLEAIVEHVPPPSGDSEGGFQMLVAALSYDNHLGQIAVGRIARGRVRLGEQVARISQDGTTSVHKVTRLLSFQGLTKQELREAEAGEIVALAGLGQVAISDTIASARGAGGAAHHRHRAAHGADDLWREHLGVRRAGRAVLDVAAASRAAAGRASHQRQPAGAGDREPGGIPGLGARRAAPGDPDRDDAARGV